MSRSNHVLDNDVSYCARASICALQSYCRSFVSTRGMLVNWPSSAWDIRTDRWHNPNHSAQTRRPSGCLWHPLLLFCRLLYVFLARSFVCMFCSTEACGHLYAAEKTQQTIPSKTQFHTKNPVLRCILQQHSAWKKPGGYIRVLTVCRLCCTC